MVANHAVKMLKTDNNDPGAPRTISIDVSALGTLTTASPLTIDANTSATLDPSATSVTPSPQMAVVLTGDGAAFLTLKKNGNQSDYSHLSTPSTILM
jgi:hypothetical protein